MSAPVPYIGSRITLITNKNIRYEGILVHIDPNESTVSLNQVRAFGTEDRIPVDGVPVAATNEIYDYIIFRSSDIKDLTVSELPGSAAAASGQRAPSDPAIVQQPQGGLYSPFAAQPQQQGQQGQQFNQWQQYPMMNPWGMNMNITPAMYYQMLQQQQQFQMQQMQQMQAQQQQRQTQTPNTAAPATTAATAAPAATPAPAAAPAKEAPKQAAAAAPAPAPAATKQATPAPAPAPAPAKQQQQQNTPVGGQKVTPAAAAAAAASGRDPKNPWGARGGAAAASSTTTHQAQSQARPQGQTQNQRPQQSSQQSQAAARPNTSSTPVGGVRSYAGAASTSRGGSAQNTFHRQTAHTGRFPTSRPGAPQRTTLPSDFDFEASNKKFDKEKIEAEIESEMKVESEEDAYNKDDFFDRLSCEALEKLQVDVDGESKTDRSLLAEQRKKDSETFGVSAVRNQYYSNAHQGGNYYPSSNQTRGGSTAAGGSNRGRGGYSSAPSSRGGRPAGAAGGSQNSNWRNAAASGSSNNTRGGHRGGRGGAHSNNQGHQNNGQQKVFRPVQRNQGEAVKS